MYNIAWTHSNSLPKKKKQEIQAWVASLDATQQDYVMTLRSDSYMDGYSDGFDEGEEYASLY